MKRFVLETRVHCYDNRFTLTTSSAYQIKFKQFSMLSNQWYWSTNTNFERKKMKTICLLLVYCENKFRDFTDYYMCCINTLKRQLMILTFATNTVSLTHSGLRLRVVRTCGVSKVLAFSSCSCLLRNLVLWRPSLSWNQDEYQQSYKYSVSSIS